MRVKIKTARHLGFRQINGKEQEEVISQWFLLWCLICSSLTICCLGLNILKSHYIFLKYWFIYILNECLPSAFPHKTQAFAERQRAVSALPKMNNVLEKPQLSAIINMSATSMFYLRIIFYLEPFLSKILIGCGFRSLPLCPLVTGGGRDGVPKIDGVKTSWGGVINTLGNWTYIGPVLICLEKVNPLKNHACWTRAEKTILETELQ